VFKKKALLWSGLIVGAVAGFFVNPFGVLGWFSHHPVVGLAVVGPFVGLGAVAGLFLAIAVIPKPNEPRGGSEVLRQ